MGADAEGVRLVSTLAEGPMRLKRLYSVSSCNGVLGALNMVSIISVGSSAISAEVRVSSQGVLPLRSVAVGSGNFSFFLGVVATGISKCCFNLSWRAGKAPAATCSVVY